MQRFAQASYALVISSTFAGVLLRIFEHIYLMVVRIAIVVAQIDILIYEYKFRKLKFFTCHILIRKKQDLVKMPRRGSVGEKLSSIGQILVPRNS